MLFSMVNAAGMPIGDSLATTWQQQIGLDYGKVRLIGSAAFVVGVVLFGQVVGYLGESTIPWIIAALLALNGILQLLQPQPMPLDITGKSHEASVGFVTLLEKIPPQPAYCWQLHLFKAPTLPITPTAYCIGKALGLAFR